MSLETLNALRKSRKITVALFTVIFSGLFYLIPALEPLKPLTPLFILLGCVVVGSIAGEDIASKLKGTKVQDIEDIVTELIPKLLELLTEDAPEEKVEISPVEGEKEASAEAKG